MEEVEEPLVVNEAIRMSICYCLSGEEKGLNYNKT